VSNLEVAWEEPSLARFYRRLASFSRLILIDKRGTGLSDRVPADALPTLEERMDDIRAVMDAVGSKRAAIYGSSEGGPLAVLFATTFPERTTALVLYGSYPRAAIASDYPHGTDAESFDAYLASIEQGWGQALSLPVFGPSVANDDRFVQWYGRLERQSASPAAALALMRMNSQIDVRPLLESVRVPTLVIYRGGEYFAHVEGSRYLAEHIPGAKQVELPGNDFLPWVGDQDALLDEIEEFLTGARVGGHSSDRVLATVLFTDIMGSTEKAAELGDRRWRNLLDDYYDAARREIERSRGRMVKTLGDGILATFDGPARAVRCASVLRQTVEHLGIRIRTGLHTGECERMGDDVGGIAVHIGARVAAQAAPDEVLVSSTVKDLVAGSGLRFVDRGTYHLHGVPGEWRLFAAEGIASQGRPLPR
jgi:class 3 adenylate cyclase/pimeloyl-ACP methyl ester carboxylesterase